jgi:hypothetical protein
VEEREGHEREREMTPPVEGGGSQIQEEQREKGKMPAVRRKRKGAWIRESREGQMEFPKGLCAISEN